MLFCGKNGKVYKSIGVQAGGYTTTEKGMQCGGAGSQSSYNRRSETIKHKCWTYDDLKDDILANRDILFQWLLEEGLIARKRLCPVCSEEMHWVACNDRSDGFKWECRKIINSKRHKSTVSIRKGSWFEQSNMTLEEILKFTYWWCQGLDQEQIKKQLKIIPNTYVLICFAERLAK